MEISKAVVLLTGAAKGLGRALAENLLSKGAIVIALDKDSSKLDELNPHTNLTKYSIDLLDETVLNDTLQAIFVKFKINVLINNAGILHNQPLVSFGKNGFTKLSNEAWDLVMNINLKVPFMLSREVAEHMIKNRTKGVIINISSISAQGNIGQCAYSASKAAIESFTKAIAKELGIFGIRAACVAPGYMNTDSTHEIMNGDYLNVIIKSVPLRRLGKVEELAEGVRFIIENDFFTGKILAIDGGLTI
ncbi:MAG: SDR family NAD(P)-dependent oxidoreductase [Bacteroidota bacterium]